MPTDLRETLAAARGNHPEKFCELVISVLHCNPFKNIHFTQRLLKKYKK